MTSVLSISLPILPNVRSVAGMAETAGDTLPPRVVLIRRAEAAVAEKSEGIGGLEDFIATLQEELRSLSIEASDKADEARKDTKESAAAEGDGSAAGGIGGRNLSSLVTFSAAAAEAIGFREAPEKKMARDMERTRKAVERDLEFAK